MKVGNTGMRNLGVLKTVNIREVWALEPQHFSAWLAENLDKLGASIGIELELRDREVGVGGFSLDILAHDIDRDRVVIIENQLTRTDHDHLGKLITYAGGLNAAVIIWISPEFRDEHRAAVDWLNVNTDESKEFFAIQIEALQIDDSLPAPNFRLVSFPNDWQKTTIAASSTRDGSERRQFFIRYFSELASAARSAGLRAQASSVDNSLLLDRLPAGSYIAAAFSREFLNVGVYIARNETDENRRIYDLLERDKEVIERELGMPLQWDVVEGRRRQQVWTATSVDRGSEASLERSRVWAIETAKALRGAFESRLIAAMGSAT